MILVVRKFTDGWEAVPLRVNGDSRDANIPGRQDGVPIRVNGDSGEPNIHGRQDGVPLRVNGDSRDANIPGRRAAGRHPNRIPSKKQAPQGCGAGNGYRTSNNEPPTIYDSLFITYNLRFFLLLDEAKRGRAGGCTHHVRIPRFYAEKINAGSKINHVQVENS